MSQPMLANQNGRKEFFFEEWNAHAIYFCDADGNISELIARHTLEASSEGPFGAGSLLGVSETGVVVDNVPATVAVLEGRYTLRLYQERSHPEFTAVGDEQEMFIVVQTNRPWLPTGERARHSHSSTTFQINNGVYAATIE